MLIYQLIFASLLLLVFNGENKVVAKMKVTSSKKMQAFKSPVPDHVLQSGKASLDLIRNWEAERQKNLNAAFKKYQDEKKKERSNIVKEGERTIEIRETPGKQVIVRVTETIKGKEKVTTSKAKSTSKLRLKDREAYNLYRKYRPAIPRFRFPKHTKPPLSNDPLERPLVYFMNGGITKNTSLSFNYQVTCNHRQRHTVFVVYERPDIRTLVIDDYKNKNIVIKMTKMTGGKKVISQYQAKSLQELRKKHPRAAKLYEALLMEKGELTKETLGITGTHADPQPFQTLSPHVRKAIEGVNKLEKMSPHYKPHAHQKTVDELLVDFRTYLKKAEDGLDAIEKQQQQIK